MKVDALREKLMRGIRKDPITECWIYSPKARLTKSYPRIIIGGRKASVHRVMYALKYGDIGNNQIHHICNNKRCINPDHLFSLSFGDHRKHHSPNWIVSTPKH